jgi:hypothetical protein
MSKCARQRRKRDPRPNPNETRLPPGNCLGNVCCVSAVELAVKKVKKLSAPRARELLGWLDGQKAKGKVVKRHSQPWWRNGTARQHMKKLKAWEDSVRRTNDWEIPRMPDDLVNATTPRTMGLAELPPSAAELLRRTGALPE